MMSWMVPPLRRRAKLSQFRPTLRQRRKGSKAEYPLSMLLNMLFNMPLNMLLNMLLNINTTRPRGNPWLILNKVSMATKT